MLGWRLNDSSKKIQYSPHIYRCTPLSGGNPMLATILCSHNLLGFVSPVQVLANMSRPEHFVSDDDEVGVIKVKAEASDTSDSNMLSYVAATNLDADDESYDTEAS